jgi:energy-coupling factor transporter ATP-binding protein EcfA2
MSEPTTSVLASVAVELAKRATEEGWLDRFRDIFRRKHRVVLLGSTGVGKSNFIKSLVEPLPEVISTLNRTSFPKRHRLKIDAQPFEFIDTPGQVLHAPRRMAEIRRLAGKRGNLGVVSLVAYGYHEYAVDISEVFDSANNVQSAFLETHRQIECDFVKTWSPLLIDPEITQWVITLASKADLWWSSHRQVEQFYSSGAYLQSLGDSGVLRPPVISYCSVVRRFFSRGELSSGFDDNTRQELRANMFRAILEAIGEVESHG